MNHIFLSLVLVCSPLFAESPSSCAGSFELREDLLTSRSVLRSWVEGMAALGPRHSGNPAHQAFLEFLAAELTHAGVQVSRMTQTYEREIPLRVALMNQGLLFRVASDYPYSGSTGPSGIEAPLVFVSDLSKISTMDLTGKILLVEPPLFGQPFVGLGTIPSLSVVASRGAVGMITILDLHPENARGQDLPFGRPQESIPGLNVDREVGKTLKVLAQTSSRVRIIRKVRRVTSSPQHLVGFLPGNNTDEVIILNTHTDGQNAFEENGGLGILAIAKYLGRLPQACRARNVVFVLSPGHMEHDVLATEAFMRDFPDVLSKTEASLIVEHLGAMEWVENKTLGYAPTGKPAPGPLFTTSQALKDVALAAVNQEGLEAVIPVDSSVGGLFLGEGIQISQVTPAIGYVPNPLYLLSEVPGGHLDKISYLRLEKEVRVFTRVALELLLGNFR